MAADYDAHGRLAGIEILDAAQHLGSHEGLQEGLQQVTLEGITQAAAA